MKRRGFLIAAAALAAPRVFARGTAKALSGDSFLDGAAEVRLADILAPRTEPLAGASEPFAEQARDALQSLLAGDLALSDAAPADRWGRRVVRAAGKGGVSLAEALLRRGAARVHPETDEYDVIRRLLECEAEARKASRGLWRMPEYRVRDALNADGAIGGYHLVEGAVASAEKHGPRVYLNFGEDYRTDFTASAKSTLARRWRSTGSVDLESLGGARLRVRGYVASINGPSIELTHPMQIERLDSAEAG